jgi:hypothetical protein
MSMEIRVEYLLPLDSISELLGSALDSRMPKRCAAS